MNMDLRAPDYSYVLARLLVDIESVGGKWVAPLHESLANILDPIPKALVGRSSKAR